ncbi:hypothetical protein ACFCYL_01935 [Streptomyces sp. NPDC056305]|uniref:hypothetical protein n=1 Tax=unclassified Streptomyces TaxID=2593676 RepID=UPI0035DC459E
MRPSAIDQWSANAPQHALARLGARVVGALSVRVAPSAARTRRVVGLICPGGLADLIGADPADSDSVAIDGKAARGSRYGQTLSNYKITGLCNGPGSGSGADSVGDLESGLTGPR